MSKQPSAAQKRQHLDPFSLSFLDIISCGFGAVVVLILIFRFDPFPDDATAPPPQADTAAAYNSLLAEAAITEKTEQAQAALDDLSSARAASQKNAQKRQQQLDQLPSNLPPNKPATCKNNSKSPLWNGRLNKSKIAGATTPDPADPDDEAGGILVDRDYVIFIVDTSGSMREI